jgi:hypothetical protein
MEPDLFDPLIGIISRLFDDFPGIAKRQLLVGVCRQACLRAVRRPDDRETLEFQLLPMAPQATSLRASLGPRGRVFVVWEQDEELRVGRLESVENRGRVFRLGYDRQEILRVGSQPQLR